MEVFYDGQIYAMQTAGGINRYFANIISRLPDDFYPTLTATYRSSKLNYPTHPHLKIIEYRRFPPARVSRQVEKRYFQATTAFKKFDLAHPTYYSLLSGQAFENYRCPIVLTVYDMIHELFSSQLDPKGEVAEAKRRAILSAQAILCISESTRNDLLDRYPSLENKISITYLASELDANLAYGAETVPSRPYYLYVGSRTAEYKNFDGLLLAFSKAVSINQELALCVVGPSFNQAELDLIANLKLTNFIEHCGHANDSQLAKLYRCSLGFVYPSLYEGFGIPPLEAMSCGTPVIAAKSSSIPEVVGDAGLLFDPKAPEDLADRLLFLADHPAERDRLIAKGFERTKLFSWNKTASQTLDVYKSVAA